VNLCSGVGDGLTDLGDDHPELSIDGRCPESHNKGLTDIGQ